jgi:ribosomal protein S18 acetylase RimI-like enzyme
MDAERIRSEFDAEVRARPVAAAGVCVETSAHVVRLTGVFNFVCSWAFASDQAAQVVADEAAEFQRRGEALIWRVYDHDRPEGLGAHLSANGFEAESHLTLLAYDLAGAAITMPPDITVRRVTTADGLRDFVSAANAAFGDDHATRQAAHYVERLEDERLALMVAYVDGEPAAAARLEISGRFGQMFGGAVTPTFRGRGAYRALVSARAAAAARCGAAHLITDARETSRPILERLGFRVVGHSVNWVRPAG